MRATLYDIAVKIWITIVYGMAHISIYKTILIRLSFQKYVFHFAIDTCEYCLTYEILFSQFSTLRDET